MATGGEPNMTSHDKHHVPDETLLDIFSYHILPPAHIIGRQRYEDINVPRGLIKRNGPIKSYADNDLHTGAYTHHHDDWKTKLRTLSAISQASRRFRDLALPLLHQVYPGQTIVKPQLCLNALASSPDLAILVTELVLNPWDFFNSPKEFVEQFKTLVLRSPGYAAIELLKSTATAWNDEAHAILLLFFCSDYHTLSLTCPAGYSDKAAVSSLFTQLRQLGPNTLARDNEEAEDPTNTLTDLPLRKVKTLSLHHAEHHYVRQLDGLAPLMRLLTVRSITVHRFWRGAAAIKNLGHIHDLILWNCTLEPGELIKALKRCRELRSLNIIFAGCTATLGPLVPEKDHVDFQELGNIARLKLTKLRKLRLDDRELDQIEPPLEELAINESCLGCYEVTGQAGVATAALADMLPPTLRTLVIFRNNLWWHHTDRGPEANALSNSGVTYYFDGMRDKVTEMLRQGQAEVPDLTSIRIDTPAKFGKDVERFGWTCEQTVGDELLVRPSIVTDSLMKPEEKRSWEITQNDRAAKPSILLKRVRL